MSNYVVKNGGTYSTVTALQAAVTLVTGDVVQLDSSGGVITEPGNISVPTTGITYTSLSGRTEWNLHTLVVHSSTIVKNIKLVYIGNTSYGPIQPRNLGGPSVNDVIIENNYFDVQSAGRGAVYANAFQDIQAVNWKIRNNIMIGSSGQIINLTSPYDDAYVYNNVLIANSSSYAIRCLGVIKNNILVGNGSGTGISSAHGGLTCDYNCVYNFGTAFSPGTLQGVHDITSDPKFVSSSNFHLQSSSPCLTSGIGPNADANVPTIDYDGAVRSGTTASMGAYEASKAPDQPVLISPIAGVRTADNTPTLTFVVPTDPSNNNLVFSVELDTVNPINPSSSDYKKYESRLKQGTWLYWNAGANIDMPTAGLGPTFYGTDASVTIPNVNRLRNAVWYWKICVSNELGCCEFNQGILGQKKFCAGV